MKKLLIAMLVTVPMVACGNEIVVVKSNPGTTPGEQPAENTDNTEPPTDTTPPKPKDPEPTSDLPEDRCLDGQDMDAADVDVSKCPAIPTAPESVPIGKDGKDEYELGAWEIGTTSTGETYKYGSLSAPGTTPRILKFEGGTAEVNDKNLECWSKGYYRLRKMLQNPPAEYLALRKAGFQYRFFQFQSDLRNGPTGYKAISSFQDHLVKWVTVITKAGVCEQPTLTKFRDYAKGELTDRGIPLPKTN